MGAVLALLMVPALGSANPNPCDGVLCAGGASVDMTWHTGSGQGQYGTEGNGFTAGKFDPFHHQTKMVPSDGMQSRLFAKAIVVKGADGSKIAFVKTELYLQQDVLTRRIAELVSGADPLVNDYAVAGLNGSRIMLGATHNHSAPEYVSTAWGVWLFTDTFDFRAFETTARKIAEAIKKADDALVPAKIGGSVTRYGDVQQNILGPAVADDGTPAGYPRDHFDNELTVIRFDSLTGEPIAAWVNLGMHPESMATHNLISGDFVGMIERLVESGMGRAPGASDGPVVAFGQGSVGDVEPDRDTRAHPASEKREYWHRDIAQAERMSRDLSGAILDTWGDVAAATPGVPEKFVSFSSNLEVAMVDYRFPGPISHPLPTVSNCRTQRPGLPAVGLPDCERGGFVPPEQYGTTVDLLQSAGLPIPDNFGTAPSHAAVQESLTIHLQAIRLGDILIGSCPCEPTSDMVINFKSRADESPANLYLGYLWDCRPRAVPQPGFTNECNFKTASYRPDDWRKVADGPYERMLAQINNPADGWENDLAGLQGEAEPEDPSLIKGNFTHEEIQDLGFSGYRLPIMLGQGNDYIGYVVTYREYMRGDHYRKALTGFGPHTSDYVNTRLVSMAAELRGGGPVEGGLHGAVITTGDGLIQTAKSLTVGKGASIGLGAYETAIPDDGGIPGTVLSQPSDVQRFGAAIFTWIGGSNWTDNPRVVVEREVSPGSWEVFATQEGGEIVVSLEYEDPSPDAALTWLLGGKTYQWTATFEVFEETPPGTYRFAVDGRHRSGRVPNSYQLLSDEFEVGVWEGITAHNLGVVLGANSASFLADGVELTEPPSQLETDDDGLLAPDEVHYPETYSSPLSYMSRAYATIGSHRYCWRCTFRPWANTGLVTSASVAVHQSDGVTKIYPASFDGTGWTASGLDLANGDVVVVEGGGVLDQFGNINGAASNAIVIEGGLDRPIFTGLVYNGATSGQIGKDAQVSATLRTASGNPVPGAVIVFSRGDQSVSAVTGADGIASALLKVEGPPGSAKPVVSFSGFGAYQPAQIQAAFEATPGKRETSLDPLEVAAVLLALLLVL